MALLKVPDKLEMVNRAKFLLGVAGTLACIGLGVWISGNWGKVTLEFENKPLGRVLDSFTRQTQLPVFTDLDRDKPVTLRIRRGTVTEALDAIQAAAESRGGRLAFLLAPDASGLARIRSLLPRPAEDTGILSLEFRIPFPAMASLEELPEWGDPRDQTWQPSPGLPPQLRPFAENAAQAAEIRILLPGDWNPSLNRIPPGGSVTSALPALAKAAGGKAEMIYLLPAPRANREPGPTEASGEWGARGGGRSRAAPLPPEKWLERLEPRLAALPQEDAVAARAALSEAVQQFKEWDDLPPEQRREKVQALMQDPASAEKMSNRFTRGMRKLSPEQRAQRYQNYNSRRESIKDPEHAR